MANCRRDKDVAGQRKDFGVRYRVPTRESRNARPTNDVVIFYKPLDE
jgi:hypothetical protein